MSPDVEPRQDVGRRLWSGERRGLGASGKVSGKVRKERQHLAMVFKLVVILTEALGCKESMSAAG